MKTASRRKATRAPSTTGGTIPRISWTLKAVFSLCIMSTGACVSGTSEATPPDLDACFFETEVYPILVRDCGFAACHGSRERFFQVYSPGRLRLEEGAPIYAATTPEELTRSFERARSMLVPMEDPGQAPLLRKPLEGNSHQGVDLQQRNVYADENDESWKTLLRWFEGNIASCE